MSKKFLSRFAGKNGLKSLVISIVILVELVAIASVATFAWVETVSSIKIATRNAQNKEDPLVVDSFVFTEAMIGEDKGTIDLADYFKKSGDMHLSPASSADGENMYFPKLNSNSTAYMAGGTAGSFRKGDFSDKNTTYMSVSFKLKADVNADFFFTQAPTFSKQGDNIRVSVTAYTEGMTKGDLYDTIGKPLYTKIYANSDSAANTKVVGNTSGTTVVTSYEAFGDHIKGKGSTAKLFSVAADETKIVTINLWLQGSSIDNSLPQDISISNFGIISDLTPRHVTLIPTDRWDTGGTAYYYAWCWMEDGSIPSRLYQLGLDENEHYSFDYNGKYDNTLFFKSSNKDLTTENMSSHWNSSTISFKSVDTTIPITPVDPTFVIKELRGGAHDSDINANKSTGMWASPDIVTIKTANVTGQSAWGTVTSTSYYGTTVTSTQQVEANNRTDTEALHHDTIHALPGKKVSLTATANANYAFVGWYDNAAGTGEALSTSTTYDFNATTDAPREITYYAKFEQLDIYLTGYINGSDVSDTTHHFTAGYNGVYTYTYKFTDGSDQWVTIFDGTNAYHPASSGAGSGTAADTSLTDTTPAGINGNKWKVDACKGTTVIFTWNSVNKTLSWTIDSRELYLEPNSNWTQSSARFAAYAYGKGDNWYSMTSAGSGYYKVTIPATYPNVIFARMNGGTTTNNWSNKWNQSGDLTIPSDKNCFTVPDGAWDGSTTTWSLY